MRIFISYSHLNEDAQRDLRRALAPLQRVLPATTVWHDGKITAGQYWAAEIVAALDAADVILLLISDAFFASEYCWEKEMPRAMARHRAGETVVVPIFVDFVGKAWKYSDFADLQSLPTGAKPIPDWDHPRRGWMNVCDGLLDMLLERKLVQEPPRPDPFAAPVIRTASAPAVRLFNIPRPENPFFTGRDEDLAWIKRTLNAANRNRARPAALLHGTGGVGKSEAAAHYAHQHRDEYQVVWWIDAERPATRDEGFSRLAEALGLPGFNPRDMAQTRAAVLQWMEGASSWLAVFDNAESYEDLQPWLPARPGGHVLVTSRFDDWEFVADVLPVAVWDTPTAAKFLRERSRDGDTAASEALATELGGLPLACEHAAAYVRQVGCGLAGYLRLLRQRFDKAAPVVFRTFTLAMEKAAEQAPLAETVMNLCACLAPEPIPRTLFSGEKGLRVLGTLSTLSPVDEFTLNAAFAALRRQALMVGERELTLHRLVQATARSRLTDSQKWDVAALTLVAKAFPFDAVDARTWEDCARLRPHAETLLAAVPDAVAPPGTADLLCNQLGLYLQERGDYPAALALYERNLQLKEKHYGPQHGETAIALSNLGQLLADMERLEEAEAHTRRALEIAEGNLGPDHGGVAVHLSNLATILLDQQRWEEAEALLRRALAIDEAALGADHPDVAVRLSNLGFALAGQGKHGEAKPLQERALEIAHTHYGDDHPTTAFRFNNLAGTLGALGDVAGAVELHAKALAIRLKWLGPDHPSTQRSRHNLAAAEEALRAKAGNPLPPRGRVAAQPPGGGGSAAKLMTANSPHPAADAAPLPRGGRGA
jgi:tetratricopeptide (TPR) repeat protein